MELPEGTDPVAFVLDENLLRRHLDIGQRAIVAAKLANMTVGGDHSAKLQNEVSVEDAAARLNVSPRSLRPGQEPNPASPQPLTTGELLRRLNHLHARRGPALRSSGKSTP